VRIRQRVRGQRPYGRRDRGRPSSGVMSPEPENGLNFRYRPVKFGVLGPLAGARQLTSREPGALGQEPPRTARTKAATLLLPLELKASTLPYRKLTNHARDGLETLDVDDQ